MIVALSRTHNLISHKNALKGRMSHIVLATGPATLTGGPTFRFELRQCQWAPVGILGPYLGGEGGGSAAEKKTTCPLLGQRRARSWRFMTEGAAGCARRAHTCHSSIPPRDAPGSRRRRPFVGADAEPPPTLPTSPWRWRTSTTTCLESFSISRSCCTVGVFM